ncbi:hypothetical protein PsYK624_123370 [Phanerochaete sordida]|uniref:Uncharacterized protein n=1 Tax=Phanerochaete sordida TaxID=48140 RepID=A0A9P3LIY3_9APHY|nr:hypothetical protein PsYK624_123370 [Phanerochaete sordida]
MKYFATLAALATTALAQGVFIGAPAANSSVYPGQWITVEVEQPIYIQNVDNVALVLAVAECPPNGCNDDPIGTIVYQGPFSGSGHGIRGSPFQNISVGLPSTITPGSQVSLSTTFFALVGASLEPYVAKSYIPLTVVHGP